MPAWLIASTLSAEAYLVGVAGIVAAVAAIGWGAWSLRRALLVEWSGAPARLAEIVLALTVTIGAAQVLGALGAFRAPFVLVSFIGCGLLLGGVANVVRPREQGRGAVPQAARGRVHAIEAGLATAGVVVVGAQWVAHTAYAVNRGMTHADTVWFHGPYAARFVEAGRITGLLDGVDLLHSYATHNAELVHAVAILPFDRDVLSPFVNLGWAALALLAAWVIGRRRGVQALSLLGAVAALALPIAAATQPGQASNDIATAALFLCAVALLVEGDLAPRPTALAALAAGLAVGTRLTVAAPVAVLTVGVIVLAWRARRPLAGLLWCALLGIAGCFWFVRNWVLAGNPLPYFELHLGPIELDQVVKPGESFSEYWTDGFVWDRVFLPGLGQAFGPLWAVVLTVTIGGALVTLARRNGAIVRVAAAVVLTGIVAYMFTPITADGGGLAFPYNLRYLLPEVLLAFVLLPCNLARADWRGRAAAGAGWIGLILAAATARHHERIPAWPSEWLVWGSMFALVAVGIVTLAPWVARRSQRSFVATVAGVVALVFAGGWFVQRHYLEHRYDDSGLALDRASAIFRDREDEKIAAFGLFENYPLFGTKLSNTVWQPNPKLGDGRRISCRHWRRVLTDGNYTYVVLAHEGLSTPGPPEEWIADDPATVLVGRFEEATVFRIVGDLQPEGCRRRTPI